MNKEEIEEWKKLCEKCEKGGNDGADVEEATQFCRLMEDKYQQPINTLIGFK